MVFLALSRWFQMSNTIVLVWEVFLIYFGKRSLKVIKIMLTIHTKQ